ncbi:MAG TPA: metallophosphoesterase [bacterium]|nr:metallophosphoesterase [bacterium]HOL49476.1 metallophosphoesterase [bacterium]HPO52495.1 metallophosphoesterase [bacterium]
MKRFLLLVLISLSYFIACSGSERVLTFVIFSDCHLKDEKTISEQLLQNIVQKINSDEQDAEFAVCLGDIVGLPGDAKFQRYLTAVEKYLAITSGLRVPIYTVPGNHDLEQGNEARKTFEKKIGPLFFSVEKNGYQLLFLNSETLNETQLEWLNTQFKKPYQSRIIFMHRPLFAVFTGHAFDTKTTVFLKQLFESHNVIAIFSGHEHLFYQKKYGNILQVISGGAGGTLVPAPEDGKSIFHYCRVKVSKSDIIVEPVQVDIKIF